MAEGNEPGTPPLADLRAVAVLVVAAVLAAVFFSRFEPAGQVLLRVATAAGSAAAVAGAALTCGRFAIRVARTLFIKLAASGNESDEPELIDELLVGAPMYGTLLAIIGLAGGLRPWIVIVLTIVLALFAIRRVLMAPLARTMSLRHFLFVPPAIIALIGALSPVSSPDELVYKLAMPKAFLLQGRMFEMPLISHSYVPSAIYIADVAALALSGGIAAKLFHVLLWMASLRIIWRVTSAIQPSAGFWSALIAATTPAFMVVAGWAWIEWPTIGLALIAVEKFVRYLRSAAATDAAICAAALAAALASNYTAIPFLVAFVIAAAFHLRRAARPVRLVATAMLVSFLFGGFFYIRNLIWTGSPVAPFLTGRQAPAIERYRSTAGGWLELVRGYDIVHPGIVDDALGVLLPLTVLFALFAVRRADPLARMLVVTGLVQLIGLVTIAPTSRLMALAVVPLGIAGIVVLYEVVVGSTRIAQVAVVATLIVVMSAQLILTGYVFASSYDVLPFVAGSETGQQYLERTRRFAKPYRWIAERTRPDAKLLLLAENRTYYLDRQFVAAGNLDGPLMARHLEAFASPEEFIAGLKRDGITHVVIHKEWYRVAGKDPRVPTMIEKEYLLIVSPRVDDMIRTALTKYGRLQYVDTAYSIFEVAR